jgi:hypothetical protein
VAEGVEAFLFDRNGQGIIILWDRGNVPGVKQLALNLGSTARASISVGNVTPLSCAARRQQRRQRRSGSVKIEVGPMPIFLVDVDGHLAQLPRQRRVRQPAARIELQPHTRQLRFTNPYRQSVSGSLSSPPAGWSH